VYTTAGGDSTTDPQHCGVLMDSPHPCQVDFCYEAPVSSCVTYIECIQDLLALPDMSTVTRIYLGAWGGETVKPLKLMTSGAYLASLATPKPIMPGAVKLVSTKFKMVDGRLMRKVTGNKKVLKDSENYPEGFGAAVVAAFLEAIGTSQLGFGGCVHLGSWFWGLGVVYILAFLLILQKMGRNVSVEYDGPRVSCCCGRDVLGCARPRLPTDVSNPGEFPRALRAWCPWDCDAQATAQACRYSTVDFGAA
jgi:hypothetical protein